MMDPKVCCCTNATYGVRQNAACRTLERPNQRAVGTEKQSESDGKKEIVQRRIPMSEARTTRAVREGVDHSIAAGAETVRDVQEGFTSAVKNVRDLNLRLIDMAQANTEAAFNFAREVAEAKGPSDFMQAWTTNATKQFDMLTKQASELTRLGQSFAIQ
jgi:hypothetical protein